MKKGFTKLEIILGAIIVFSIIGYLGSKNVFTSKEKLLRQRFNTYISLLNQKKYSEAYSYLNSSSKTKITLSDYQRVGGNGKQTVIINGIIIKDNIGYIDRTNTICNDDNCISKDIIRGYKKWVFENGNWYFDSDSETVCIREEMYDIPTEFKRALSLISQRYGEKFGGKSADIPFLNCLNIQYSKLDQAEGIFTFDPDKSNLDNLSIYVDNSYKTKDDILTAFLLSHEIFHAGSYLTTLNFGSEISCYDEEIQAFQSQLTFLGSLNQEEQNSLVSRISALDYSNNSPLIMVKEFLDYSGKATRICGKNNANCYSEQMTKQITNMVKDSPYYQKQCNLN